MLPLGAMATCVGVDRPVFGPPMLSVGAALPVALSEQTSTEFPFVLATYSLPPLIVNPSGPFSPVLLPAIAAVGLTSPVAFAGNTSIASVSCTATYIEPAPSSAMPLG